MLERLKAGRVLRETSPIEEFKLIGMVVRLERPAGADTGTVTGFTEEQTHLVRVELSGRGYDVAVRAHADRH